MRRSLQQQRGRRNRSIPVSSPGVRGNPHKTGNPPRPKNPRGYGVLANAEPRPRAPLSWIGVAAAAHLLELLSEQISGPTDESFDLCLEGRCIARRVLPRHIAAGAELCNCGIDAVKFDRLDAPFAERQRTDLKLVEIS